MNVAGQVLSIIHSEVGIPIVDHLFLLYARLQTGRIMVW